MAGFKITSRTITLIIAFLLIIIAVLSYLNMTGEKLPEGRVKVKAGNEIIGEISLEEVKTLPAVNKKLVIDSTSGFSKHNFTCTPLLGVLNAVDLRIPQCYKRVITRGVDNYVSGVDMEEVLEENNVFLVYADNGEALNGQNGVPGTMRIVILNDLYGQRFTNYLVEIELE